MGVHVGNEVLRLDKTTSRLKYKSQGGMHRWAGAGQVSTMALVRPHTPKYPRQVTLRRLTPSLALL